MNIKPLLTSASKAEEFAALQKVARLFPDQTYLHGLFSHRLLSWVEQEIRNDFTCDIFSVIDALTDRLNAAVSTATKIQGELNAERRNHAQQVAPLKTDLQEAEEIIADRDAEISRLRNEKMEYYGRINELSHEVSIRMSNQSRQLEEITALKVRLYDLTNPVTA